MGEESPVIVYEVIRAAEVCIHRSGGRVEGPAEADADDTPSTPAHCVVITLVMVVDDVEVCLSSVTMKKTVWGTPETVRVKDHCDCSGEEKVTNGKKKQFDFGFRFRLSFGFPKRNSFRWSNDRNSKPFFYRNGTLFDPFMS